MKQLMKLLIGTLFVVALASCHSPEQAPSVAEPQQHGPKVRITTNMGDIVLELYPDKAPKTSSSMSTTASTTTPFSTVSSMAS
jgi:hypothetical protein